MPQARGTVRAAHGRALTRPSSGRAGVEVGPGSPAEDRLGDQYANAVLGMVELLGRVPAVQAAGDVALEIGHQVGATALDGHVQQPAEAQTALVGGEVAVRGNARRTEAHPGGLELSRGRHRGETEEGGRDRGPLRLDLGVPQKAARRFRQALEGLVDQAAVFRRGRAGHGWLVTTTECWMQ
ncbi:MULTISPECIES: hypothetical protein [unclassified Streptomyces]|uniref:hypothetical protein n=1 Tax=unclassified Streptomyces TaxID=2593676 RepID=UPI0022574B10|nr:MULTISPECIES: hypothetical protein [unclassified Streptomyces]